MFFNFLYNYKMKHRNYFNERKMILWNLIDQARGRLILNEWTIFYKVTSSAL